MVVVVVVVVVVVMVVMVVEVAQLPLLKVCFWECETSCFGVFAILVLPSTATNSEKNVSQINNWQICIRHSIYKKIILLFFRGGPPQHPYPTPTFFCFLAVTRTKVFQAKSARTEFSMRLRARTGACI